MAARSVSVAGRRWLGGIATGLALMLTSVSCFAETHALVVGVDRYRNLRSLRGAVADAMDIAGALRRRGVADLILLVNEEASRARVLASLDAIVAKAKADDLVVISFAGHGAREQWGRLRPPGVAPGATREVFLLGDITIPNAAGRVDPLLGGSAGERIAGAEMNLRLGQLEAKGVRTIFVADTCHAGGLSRAPLFDTGSYRFVRPYSFRDEEDPLAATLGALPRSLDVDKELPRLTFLAAVEDTQTSPEIVIPKGSGSWRGALSYAFARAIDGSIPLGGSGAITRGDLVSYVTATIRTHADNRQEPDLRPRSAFQLPVIDIGRDFSRAGASSTSALQAQVPSRVRVFVADAGAALPLPTMTGPVKIEAAPSLSEADLILRDGNAYSQGGDLIASRVRPADLPKLAEREVALRQLLALSLDRPRGLRLGAGDKRYLMGERVGVDPRPSEADVRIKDEHYLLFNISGTGQVQFLYPQRKANGFRVDDPLTLPENRSLTSIEAAPPAGTEMLVLVTSAKPLSALLTDISKLDGRPEPLRAAELIARSLDGNIRIGLQGLFTAPAGP